jgi:hypothetical protein
MTAEEPHPGMPFLDALQVFKSTLSEGELSITNHQQETFLPASH